MSRSVLRFSCLYLCTLLVSSGALAKDRSDDLVSPRFASTGGFCFDGVTPDIRWLLNDGGLTVWGSFCVGDTDTGRVDSGVFLAPPSISLYLSGYVGSPGLRLALRNPESREELELRPPSAPGQGWRSSSFDIPTGWVGKPVQIIAEDHATGMGGWFGFTAPLLPYALVAIDNIPTNHEQTGFCTDGVPSDTSWPAGHAPPGVVGWGSYCQSGAKDTGWKASNAVIAGSYLTLYLAGYPGTPGIRLAAENLKTGHQLPLQVRDVSGPAWRLYHFPLPSSWTGQPVRLLAQDERSGVAGWIGFTDPTSASGFANPATFAYRLLGLVLRLFAVLMLPPAAAVVFAIRRGVKDSLDLTATGLLAMGAVGYAAFCAYFLSPILGVIYSYSILGLSFSVILYGWIRIRRQVSWLAVGRLLQPFILVGLASIFVISTGFVYGKPDLIQNYAAHRFGPLYLWIDNFLPKLLADGIFHHHIPPPLPWGWLSSDRPPLQTGIVLWNYPWTRNTRDLPYQIMATISQLTFLAGLLAYLESSKASRKVTTLTLATVFLSGFTILNSFYTWPKLLPVAFLFIIAAYLFTDRFCIVRSDWKAGVVVGAATAFAMLCHGGSAFALLGIAATALLLRRVPGRRFLLSAGGTAALLYLPWSLYQKYDDPPGDRLLRMHLAGSLDPHPEAKLFELLVASYKKLGMHWVLEYKISNAVFPFRESLAFWRHLIATGQALVAGDQEKWTAAVAWLRACMFLHWFPAIDIFMFAPGVLLLGLVLHRRKLLEFQEAWKLWLCTAVTLVGWCVLMFGPSATLVHGGSYFTVIAAYAGGTLAFWALSPRLAVFLSGFHILLNSIIFIFLTPPKQIGFDTFMGPLDRVLSCASVLAALAFLLVLWGMAKGEPCARQS